jgi:hypothetical protein
MLVLGEGLGQKLKINAGLNILLQMRNDLVSHCIEKEDIHERPAPIESFSSIVQELLWIRHNQDFISHSHRQSASDTPENGLAFSIRPW